MEFSLLFRILLVCIATTKLAEGGKFEIDYEHDTFLKDGKPFRYVSGSFHYSRTHPEQWEDRIIKMRAAGLNAVQTVVPWNWHEFSPGVFTWDGASDLIRFLELAKRHDLVVLLRLGPYICGEWEFGGFPAWLLSEDPNMVFRTSDPAYMKYVTRWMDQLLHKIKPSLYNNGGAVAMVQIENEYGSYFACDRTYTASLRDQVRQVLGQEVVIYTTDGGADYFLKCGAVPGVYATIDFGITFNASKTFAPQRDYEPHGPFVNSEFYTGWLDHWGTKHSTVDSTISAKSLDILLDYNASINMYMYIGGTNFGFYNGANSPPYQPVPTSYDYNSPISEAGDLTRKFYAIRDIVSKYLPLPTTPIPDNSDKGNYGAVPMKFISSIQDALPTLTPQGPHKNVYPVNMEALKHYFGFILYRCVLTKDYTSSTPLSTTGVRDRAVVMVNGVPFGLLDRDTNTTVAITGTKGQQVDILVENQGRIGFSTGMNWNTKGLVSNVTLGGEMMLNWEMFPINLDYINKTMALLGNQRLSAPKVSANGKMTTPSIYTGEFTIPDTAVPLDTFLDPRPFGKGQAYINNFNIGRYWPGRGPQVTLFVPKPILHKSSLAAPANKVYLFEVESAPISSNLNVTFTDTPTLDGPNNPDDPYLVNHQGRHH